MTQTHREKMYALAGLPKPKRQKMKAVVRQAQKIWSTGRMPELQWEVWAVEDPKRYRNGKVVGVTQHLGSCATKRLAKMLATAFNRYYADPTPLA